MVLLAHWLAPAPGLKPDDPARTVVTLTCPDTLAESAPVGEGTSGVFAHLRKRLPLMLMPDQLGLLPRLKGAGPQRCGPCPLHQGDGRGREFVLIDVFVAELSRRER